MRFADFYATLIILMLNPNNKHDCGKGFYLTENVELAMEWAVCRPDETNRWVHYIDIEILEELLSLGGLGIRYCVKSELAYSKLTEMEDGLLCMDYNEFNDKYYYGG